MKRSTVADLQSTCSADSATRLALLVDVYEYAIDSSETLEGSDKVGPDLAYLLAAIAKGTDCEWPASRGIVRLLRAWARWDEVSRYITIADNEEAS